MYIGIAGAISGSVSIISCLLVLSLMVIYKKYVFSFQRLIIYLTISILLDDIDRTLQGAFYEQLSTNWRLCKALAFLSQYWSLCILLAVACVLVEMFLQVIARWDTNRLQLLYPATIFLLPAIVAWIPFVTGSYGFTGCFCSIRYTDLATCAKDTRGMVMKIILWWVPFNLTAVFGGLAYICILCSISRQRKQYSALIEVDRNIQYEQFVRDVGYFKWFPLILLIINIVPLVADLHNFFSNSQPLGELWAVSAVVKGLQGGVIAVAITLDPNTRKVLNCRSLTGAWYNNVLRKKSVEEYPIIAGRITDSLNFSDGKGVRLT